MVRLTKQTQPLSHEEKHIVKKLIVIAIKTVIFFFALVCLVSGFIFFIVYKN
jgi:hypothetical protein